MNNPVLADVLPTLERNLRLFVQYNSLPKIPTLSSLDLLEITNIVEDELKSQCMTEYITIQSKQVKIGGYTKYKKDTAYVGFWTDVENTIREMLNTVFLRTAKLSTCTKQSPHPMLAKYYSLILAPMFEHFGLFHPENVLVGSKQFFNQLKEIIINMEVNTHPTDALVAKSIISKILTTKKPLSTQQRIAAIKTAAVRLQGINTINVE